MLTLALVAAPRQAFPRFTEQILDALCETSQWRSIGPMDIGVRVSVEGLGQADRR